MRNTWRFTELKSCFLARWSGNMFSVTSSKLIRGHPYPTYLDISTGSVILMKLVCHKGWRVIASAACRHLVNRDYFRRPAAGVTRSLSFEAHARRQELFDSLA